MQLLGQIRLSCIRFNNTSYVRIKVFLKRIEKRVVQCSSYNEIYTGLKSAYQKIDFSYFSTKTCVVGTQKNRLK